MTSPVNTTTIRPEYFGRINEVVVLTFFSNYRSTFIKKYISFFFVTKKVVTMTRWSYINRWLYSGVPLLWDILSFISITQPLLTHSIQWNFIFSVMAYLIMMWYKPDANKCQTSKHAYQQLYISFFDNFRGYQICYKTYNQPQCHERLVTFVVLQGWRVSTSSIQMEIKWSWFKIWWQSHLVWRLEQIAHSKCEGKYFDSAMYTLKSVSSPVLCKLLGIRLKA
jgi:hypothetical protein